MATLDEIRAQYPQYNDMSDGQLADALYSKFYSDMPRDQFDSKVGLKAQSSNPYVGKVDAIDSVVHGLTSGFSDELEAARSGATNAVTTAFNDALSGTMPSLSKMGQAYSDTYGERLKQYRDALNQYRKESPVASTASEVLGGALTGGTLSKGGVTLMNAAKPTVGSMLARGATEGALYGGAYGFGTGEGGTEQRLANAGLNAATGAVTGGVMGAASGKLASNAATKAIPTTDELKSAANSAYNAVDQAGVVLKPSSFSNAVDDIAQTAQNAGIDKTIHPKATAALARLEEAKGAQPTLGEVDTLRRVLKGAAASNDRDERRIASLMVNKLDDYVGNLGLSDVVAGDPMAASSALNKARDLWSRMSKSDLIENALTKAERQAASTGSGGNADNAIRQQIKTILNGPKARGFTQEERDLMEKVVRGGPVQNLMRLVGKLSPSGNGLMAALGLGATATNPLMGIAPAAGLAAKTLAQGQTSRNVNNLLNVVRSGGSLPVPQPLSPAQQALLQSAIIGGAQQGPRVREQIPPFRPAFGLLQ